MPAVTATRPFSIVDGTSGSATDWTRHTFPTWVRVVGVQNVGTGTLYVATGKSGAAGGTPGGVQLAAGDLVPFALTSGQAQAAAPYLDIFGADGLAHALRFICQESAQ